MVVEEAIPSLLASFHSWLTPTVLFVLLNIVIGTIAVTSKTSRRQNHPIRPAAAAANESVAFKLARSSSAFLQRISSFNLPTEKPLDPPPPLIPPSPTTDPTEPDPAPKDPATCELGEIDLHFEEARILKQADRIGGEEGREVDARADDFINRFRQQLKLQRHDSLIRYKEMIRSAVDSEIMPKVVK